MAQPSLNNHERARRDLWVNVYTNELVGVEPYTQRLIRATERADTALHQFDKRFAAPKD